MNVCSICAPISVTITNIWIKFGTENKYGTINTPEWPNSHKLKIQNGGGRYLGFRKMSIAPNWIELLRKIWWIDALTAVRRWHMTKTKTRNRNFFAWRYCCDEYRKHNICADVDKSSQLPNLSLSLCRTHLFALFELFVKLYGKIRLLICHTSLINKL